MPLPNDPLLARQQEIVTEQNEIVRDARVFGIATALVAAGSLIAARQVESKPKSAALRALGLVLVAADTIGAVDSWVAIEDLNAENSRITAMSAGYTPAQQFETPQSVA